MTKYASSYFRRQTRTFAVIVFVCIFLTLGCGKRKPPVPPKEKVAQRAEISGFQRGNKVRLAWKMPARNAKQDSVQNIDRVDIYRLAEPLDASLTLTEEEFASRSNIIATLKIVDSDFGLNTLSWDDVLQFAAQPVRLRYAIRFANASGQKAAFSNILLVEPASRVASAPSELSSQLSQGAVKLKWNAPTTNIDGTQPVSILGYNIYRSRSENEAGRLLNKTPIAGTEFEDEFFDFGKEYYYFVRAVSVGTQAEPVESSESNVLKLKPIDTFAPTPPASITLAAGNGVISIFFAVNPEKDIAGYRIYRSIDKDLPLDKWPQITSDLLEKNTFQDTTVESGKTYFYYITATDKYKNISEPSDVVSETVP